MNERGKPYACVDVDLPDHPKLQKVADPAGCTGLWLAMLCYAREHLTDGFVPKAFALRKWSDAGNTARLRQMVRVGLIRDCGEDFEVLRYAPRNQTKAMVEEAKKKAREKMRTWRGNQVVTGNKRVTKQMLPDSRARSESEIEKETDRESEPALAQVETNGAPNGERYVRRTNALDDELRAIAEVATVQDIPGAWAKFTGHYADKWIHVAGKWQHWCTNEAKRERVERERFRAEPPSGPVRVHDTPEAIEARQRVRDAAEAKYGSATVPAAAMVGDLMAALKPKAGGT